MKTHIRKIISFLGHNIGFVFSKTPISFKKNFAKFLLLGTKFPRIIANTAYEFSFPLIKQMLKGNENVFLKRNFGSFVMNLDATQKTQRQILYLKQYEQYITRYIMKNLRQGDVFIDIGAHVGFLTLCAAERVGAKGCVMSCEASRKNFSLLKENIALNNAHQIIAYNGALSDFSGKGILYLNPLNDGGHSLEKFLEYRDSHEKRSYEEIKKDFPNSALSEIIPIKTLDTLLDEFGLSLKPRLIKIDVEGAEKRVLYGMRNELLYNSSLSIICEITKHKSEILNTMRQYGFRIFFFDKNGLRPFGTNELIPNGNFLFEK